MFVCVLLISIVIFLFVWNKYFVFNLMKDMLILLLRVFGNLSFRLFVFEEELNFIIWFWFNLYLKVVLV